MSQNNEKWKQVKETKEIYKPGLASINYYKASSDGYNKGEIVRIEISDKSSKKAFETLKKIKELEKQ